MFLMRVSMPDRPGALGAVASAVGLVGCDIKAIEIVESLDGHGIDDFMLEIPTGVLPDTVVSACQEVSGVEVLWISRHYDSGTLQSDLETLEQMTRDPEHAAEVLVDSAPSVFHCQWSVLVDRADSPSISYATPMAPDLDATVLASIGDLGGAGSAEMPAGWVPAWSDTALAWAPVGTERSILVGRTGGPVWLASEIARLRHLSALAS
ncbi:amino acid-binding protein [Raineyella fluvialis]|uniref:Amino acid-binding protein n=2 Tax=Raineyella fluvialis TaxID=2662261 RepID=A0A5Q2FBQ1_9ACTN|nr:amino acid-binding protein [Raineyella fluvialis]